MPKEAPLIDRLKESAAGAPDSHVTVGDHIGATDRMSCEKWRDQRRISRRAGYDNKFAVTTFPVGQARSRLFRRKFISRIEARLMRLGQNLSRR
jgi:hypothetical protein